MKITQQTQIQSDEVQTLNLAQNRNAGAKAITGGNKIPNANRFSAPTYSNKAKPPAPNSPLGRLASLRRKAAVAGVKLPTRVKKA